MTSAMAEGVLSLPAACLRFLVRSTKKEDESDGGFALRLAHENGLSKPIWLTGKVDTSVVSTGLGRARWCATCLFDSEPWWRKQWVCGPAICVQHQCWLEDRCPRCGKEANWRFLRFLSCRCGAGLHLSKTRHWAADVEALLIARPNASNPSWSSLPVASRWRIAELLGALDRHGLAGKPLKRAAAARVEVEREHVTAGAGAMLGTSGSVVDLLARIRSVPRAARGAQLLGEAFPGLLPMLRKRLDDKERSWVMPHLRAFVHASLEDALPVVWRQRTTGATSSAKAVGRALGVRPERVGSLLAAVGGETVGRVTSTGRKMLAIAPSTIERVRASLADSLSMTAASSRFGVSPVRLVELVRVGYVAGAGPGVTGSSIEALVSRIARGSSRRGEVHFVEGLSLTQAMRLFIPTTHTVAFVDSLLEGRIHVIAAGKHPTSFRDLYVDRGAAEAASSNERTFSHDELPVPEVARELRLKQEVVYHLVREGLLPSVVGRCGRRTARVVARAALERFRAEVQPLVRVAADAGVGGRGTLEWAASAGLVLVSGPTVDGGRQYFVRIASQDRRSTRRLQ